MSKCLTYITPWGDSANGWWMFPVTHYGPSKRENVKFVCLYGWTCARVCSIISVCLCSLCIICFSLCHVLRRSYSRCIERNSATERAGKPPDAWLVAQHQELYQSKELEPKSIHQHSCCFCCHDKYTKDLCRHTFKIIFLWNWFFKDSHFSSCYVYLCEQKCIVGQIKTVHV